MHVCRLSWFFWWYCWWQLLISWLAHSSLRQRRNGRKALLDTAVCNNTYFINFFNIQCTPFSTLVYLPCLALPLAILGPRVGRTMNRRSPCRSVVHFPDYIFELQSCPWSDIVYPCCFRLICLSVIITVLLLMCGSLTVSALTCLVCPVLLSQRATVMCVTVSYQQTNQYGDGEGNNILHSPCADRSFF